MLINVHVTKAYDQIECNGVHKKTCKNIGTRNDHVNKNVTREVQRSEQYLVVKEHGRF